MLDIRSINLDFLQCFSDLVVGADTLPSERSRYLLPVYRFFAVYVEGAVDA